MSLRSQPQSTLASTSRRGARAHLVREAHAVEDVAQVLGGGGLALGEGGHGGGEVALGRALLGGSDVDAAVAHGDLGAAHELDGEGGAHLHEIGPGDLGDLLLDRGEEGEGIGEAGVGAVVDLGGEADAAVGAAAEGELVGADGGVEGAGVVPGEADEDGSAVGLLDEVGQELLGLGELLDVGCPASAGEFAGREAAQGRGGTAAEGFLVGESSGWAAARARETRAESIVDAENVIKTARWLRLRGE